MCKVSKMAVAHIFRTIGAKFSFFFLYIFHTHEYTFIDTYVHNTSSPLFTSTEPMARNALAAHFSHTISAHRPRSLRKHLHWLIRIASDFDFFCATLSPMCDVYIYVYIHIHIYIHIYIYIYIYVSDMHYMCVSPELRNHWQRELVLATR